ncbi:MAG: large repetitive protein [Acidobacteriota bacterium]|nr:large repetitive protein [Acidobacteriota bacterium]
MIAAVVLGAVALISLAYMLLGSSSSSKPPTSGAKPKPSPATVAGRPTAQTPSDLRNDAGGFIPQEIRYGNESPPSVPEAERNIFAFYVPPPPKATPIPTPIPTPTPTPPNLVLASISPVNVYAHTSDFTLDVMGDKFTPDTHIYIGGAELPTRFVSPQQLSTKVPAQLISFEGARQLVVRSRDGQLFSSTATLNVMPAPVPNYILIGITLRPGSNDTAVLKEKSSSEVLNAQRGDIVGGRFRVTSISKSEVVLVDTTLKIKYPLLLTGDNSNPNATGQPRYQPPTSDEEPQL